jgi:hypothetical protein
MTDTPWPPATVSDDVLEEFGARYYGSGFSGQARPADAVSQLAAILRAVTPVSKKIVAGEAWTTEELEQEVRDYNTPMFGDEVLELAAEIVWEEAFAETYNGRRLHDRVLAALKRSAPTPDFDLRISSAAVKAAPHALTAKWSINSAFMRSPEPSAVERLAALEDPATAKRVQEMDERLRDYDKWLLL